MITISYMANFAEEVGTAYEAAGKIIGAQSFRDFGPVTLLGVPERRFSTWSQAYQETASDSRPRFVARAFGSELDILRLNHIITTNAE